MIRPFIHIILHFALPALVARIFFRKNFLWAFVIMSAAILIDMDHLLADPVYDPGRCSIGFHPLHTVWASAAYIALAIVPGLRIIGTGLVIHILLDISDCIMIGWNL